MGVYITAIIFSMVSAYYAQNVKEIRQLKSTYRFLCVMSFLPMTFVSVFRYQVGTDWPIYNDYFYWISEGTDRFTEPLFNLLNRVVYLFTRDSWWLFAVCALIIGYFTFRTIFEQSIYPAFSILIFVITGDYFNSQNQIRQAIAMAVFLYGVKYIKARDWKRYFFWILVAFLTHTSAAIYVPFYFLYGLEVKAGFLGALYAGLIITFPVVKRLLVLVVSKTKYGWYFQSLYNMNNFYILGFLVTGFFLVLMLYYYYYGRKYGVKKADSEDAVEEDLEYNLMVYMYFFAALSVLFSSVIPQMVRITTALTYGTSLSIPRMVIREHRQNRRIVLYMLVVGVFVVKLLYDVYHNGWYDALPYQWVFHIL